MRFILGRAGSGKTYYCLNKMAQLQKTMSEKRMIMIVPEQSTFITERALVTEFSPPGFCRGEIMSFSRLVHRAKMRQPGKLKGPLSELGKKMLITKILYEQQDVLRTFAASAKNISFPETVLEAISELKMYNVLPLDLAKVRVEDDALRDKLSDIYLLYERFQLLAEEHHDDPRDGLNFLAQEIKEQNFLQGAHLLIDGFSVFTPQELLVIEAFLQKAEQVEITLACDPDQQAADIFEMDLFYNVLQTKEDLQKLADKNGVEVKEPIICMGQPGRFAKDSELAFIEKNFFPLTKKDCRSEQTQQLEILVAADRQEEITGIAQRILYLVREEGWHYRDISVITRDIMPYEEILQTVFTDLGIPFFIDTPKTLFHHPLIELIRASFEVARDGWHYASVFRYLKNPLVPLTLSEADQLENYCLAAGIRPYQWTTDKDWHFFPKDLLPRSERGKWQEKSQEKLALINDWRKKGRDALFAFTEVLAKPCSINEVAGALRLLLEQLHVAEKLHKWQQEAIEKGDAESAAIYGQVWDKVVLVLEEAETFLGAEVLPCEQICGIFDTVFSGLKMSLIPPGLDQVFVSSLERSRSPEIKASFVIGVNNDVFPAKIKPQGVFSTRDREDLAGLGINLAPSAERKQLEENYLVYIALTRASEKIYLSYCLSDEEGQKMQPSMIIGRLKELFVRLEERFFSEDNNDPLFLTGGYRTLAQLAEQLSKAAAGIEGAAYWRDVYNYYLGRAEYADVLTLMLEGLFYLPGQKKLNKDSLQRLYGSKLRSSVSRLEKYRTCPLAYFAAYGLKLENRQLYQLSPLDRGKLFHEILAMIGKRINQEKISWSTIDESKAEQLVEESLEQYLPQLSDDILASSARYTYLAKRIKDTLVMAVKVMVTHMQNSSFEPIAWEITFGPQKILPSLRIPLSDSKELEISGQIDRIDLAVGEGKSWFRIIDYKTGRNSLSAKDIFYGLKLQLLVYLHLVLENSAVFGVPTAAAGGAGIYYSLVRDDFLNLPLSDASDKKELLDLRLEGLAVQDQEAVQLGDHQISGHSALLPVAMKKDGNFYGNSAGLTERQLQLLREHLLEILRQTAGQMLEGLVTATPQEGQKFAFCDYCDYRDFCAFDLFLLPHKKENPPLKTSELWSLLGEEESQDE
ncbi:MAG: helicase-exonuclease AddAB subunit AddB [Bacillota bacterium]|jgi:ATP-dependent helicase/nuclease subunit B